jgi:Glycosyl hydrolase family 65, N-terminal domain
VPPVPALVPVADWSRVRLVLDDNPQLMLDGEFLSSVRQLDMRRGMLLADLSYRAHAGITVSGGELRLVSLADRAMALQLLRFSLDRDGIDVMLEANFAMAGMGMEPLQLDRDVCAWRTEGSGKAVAMAGSVALRADGNPLVPERSFSLRWDLALAFGCRTGARTRPPGFAGGIGNAMRWLELLVAGIFTYEVTREVQSLQS